MTKRGAQVDTLKVGGLSAEDLEWLKTEAERLGCDVENYVRILIRQRRAPIMVAALPTLVPATYRDELVEEYRQQLRPDMRFERAEPEPEPEPSFGTAVPVDEPSLDELMRTRPLFFDETPTRPAQRSPTQSQPRYREEPQRNVVPMRSATAPYAGGAHGAFSLTQPVGLSERVARAPMQGDGLGNVIRQNNTWIGFSNGSRRG
jgi:hypothetical protein